MSNWDAKRLVDRLQSISQEVVDSNVALELTHAINCILDQRKTMERALELLDDPSKALPWERDAQCVLTAALGRLEKSDDK